MSFKQFIPAFIRLVNSFKPEWATNLAIKLFLSPQRYPRTKEEEEFWNKGKLEVFSSGCKGRSFGDSRRTVWVVHGWESRGSRFKVLIEACRLAGYKVIAWDGPAHGDSVGDRTNMVEFAKKLRQDIESRSDELVQAVIGHSFGAAAAAYACKQGLNIKKLILISAPASVLEVLSRFWQMIQFADDLKPAFVDAIQKETGVKIEDVSLESYIASLPQKIQIVHDKSDKEIPYTEAEILKSRNNSAELVATEKLGHRRILESQIVATLVLKFINS